MSSTYKQQKTAKCTAHPYQDPAPSCIDHFNAMAMHVDVASLGVTDLNRLTVLLSLLTMLVTQVW